MTRTHSLLLLVALAGCSESDPAETATSSAPALAEGYWLAAPPADPVSVFKAREGADGSGAVVVVGRVSGLVDGRAQLKLTDASFTPCNERPGDTCQTPWDYCCEEPDELALGTVVVEVHEDGRLAKTSFEGFHGLDLLKEVVVEGTATKDEAGNVTVVATGIHVPGA